LAWTVQILPYVEESVVSEESLRAYKSQKNAYADDDNNGKMNALNSLLLPMYLCPSDPELKNQTEKFGNSDAAKNRKGMSYAGVSGSYFARTGICPVGQKSSAHFCVRASTSPIHILGPNNYDGLLIQGWPVKLRQATHGTSKTFLIGERTYQIRAWMIGAYWVLPTDPANLPRQSIPKGPQPATAFFASKNLSKTAPLNQDPLVNAYVDHNNDAGDRPPLPPGAKKEVSCNDLPFGSFHPGGANFSFGDGSVRMINDDVSVDVYLAYGSRNGDEVAVQ
jgi:prepilin-type processing-associated H-X9-DG protein